MGEDRSGAPETVIVLARDQTSFYEFLRSRQERGGTLVVLDRRDAPREGKSEGGSVHEDRRGVQPEAALALMSVLGFMVLHRDGDRWTV
jgi:hypothetical protein